MADRKRQVSQAIQESVEMSTPKTSAPAPAKSTGPSPQEAKGIAARIKKTKTSRTREMMQSAADASALRLRGSGVTLRENDEANRQDTRANKTPLEQRKAAAKAEYAALPEAPPLMASSQFERSQLKPRKKG